MKNDSQPSQQENFTLQGIPVSAGYVICQAHVLNPDLVTAHKRDISEQEVAFEIKRFEDALIKTRSELKEIKDSILKDLGESQADIFNAHLMVLQDRTFIEEIIQKVEDEHLSVDYVFVKVLEKYAQIFSAINDPYIRERIVDIKDVGKRVLKNLVGLEHQSLENIKEDVVVIAHDLAPSDTALMHKNKVAAFVTEIGSRTSHTAIMARSLQIPAVVGVKEALQYIQTDSLLIVDGHEGKVILAPSNDVLAHYRQKMEDDKRYAVKLERFRDLPAKTKDGHQVDLLANIEQAGDVNTALRHGAEGVGLFRTEFLYMNRVDLPSEDEHFEVYKQVATMAGSGEVIIRTLDLGGDKFLSRLDVPNELNPFLGWRAIRFCLERQDIFKVQLRAILRASVYGRIKLMYPMISGIEEFRLANEVLDQMKQSLKDSQIPFNPQIQVGVMIEVPSAALTADLLAKEADFFSIGTNDLIQYTLAVDRVNEKIAHMYQPAHPAVLRALQHIIQEGHKQDIPVGMCGEMSAETRYTMLLLGLGLNSMSVSPANVPAIKRVIRAVTLKEAQEFAQKALTFQNAEQFEEFARETLKHICHDDGS